MNNFDPSLMNLTKLMPNQVGLMYVGGFFIFKIETSIQNITTLRNKNIYTK